MVYGNKFHGYGILNENFYSDYRKEVQYVKQDYDNDMKIGKECLKEKNYSNAEERFRHALKLVDEIERIFEKCLSKYPNEEPSSAYNFDRDRENLESLINRCRNQKERS